MNRFERERLTRQENALLTLGFTQDERTKLRRISNTLRRWYELECGDECGFIDRDEETDQPYYHRVNLSYLDPYDPRATWRIADRENGAKLRLNAIIADRNARACVNGVCVNPLTSYLQTDPRGAALYILRPGDVPAGADPSCYYSRGICVY